MGHRACRYGPRRLAESEARRAEALLTSEGASLSVLTRRRRCRADKRRPVGLEHARTSGLLEVRFRALGWQGW